MSFTVHELPKAKADKRSIVEWIHERSPAGAAAWLDAYDSAVEQLKKRANSLDSQTLEDVFSEVPSFRLDASRFEAGLSLIDALIDANLASSKGEARRLIAGDGVYVNNRRIEAADVKLGKEHLLAGRLLVFRSGKKKYSLGKLES